MTYKSKNVPEESEKGCYHAVSLSGGKDSTAMLLLMIERDMPIDMPFMDGLEMSRRLLEERPDTILIFLTGYDEFEYARTALKLGASDYILKPVDMEVFEALLAEIRRKYEEAAKRRDNMYSVFSDVIHRREDASCLQKNLSRFGKETGQVYCCLMFKLLGFGLARSVLDHDAFCSYLQNFSDLLLECRGQELFFEGQEDEGRYLLIVGNKSREAVEQTVGQILRKIQQNERIRDDYPVLCAVSDLAEGEEGILTVYEQCKEIIKTSRLYDDTRFIRYSELNVQKERADNVSYIENAFADTLRTFDKKAIRMRLEGIVADIRGSGRDSLLYGHVFVATVFSDIMKVSQEAGMEAGEFYENFTQEYEKIIQMDNLTVQIRRIAELLEKLCDAVWSNKASPHASIIQEARKYIDSNYTDSTLSLQYVSAHVHMSPSYFSVIFKQAVGKSFITYLTDLRLERARNLLQYTSQKAYEIGYAVGYDNPTYFSTLFKKNFGVGPIEYRQQFADDAAAENIKKN